MDERTLHVLEFDKVIAALAAETAFSGGRALAEALVPTANPIWIEEGQSETAEAVAILEAGEAPPLGGLSDIRPYVDRAFRQATLQPQELLDIADTVAGAQRLARFVRQKASPEGVLADVAAGIGDHRALEAEIRRCIGEEGQVRDQASPKLARLRAEIRALQGRIRSRIESIMREADAKRYLQDAIVTVRNGRYVLPVRQEYRSGVPGIVHDQSSSGATLFIEPLAVVELGNELRNLEAQEAEEVERILAELSGKVAAQADALSRTVHAAARLDFAFAKARLALRWRCVRPVLTKERWLHIKGGRHPLLPPETVVPIDIWLGREKPALVITGPNTGGKTVTLKTVGLFVLMAQAGLQVPAEPGTELPLCDGVYVDIGDEQSIEQSLSTFSSHMSHIVRILRHVTPRSLVLLDELGAGTDPTEGAALAMAILEHLIGVACLTVATTHYSELKTFAYTAPGVTNASVEFDVATLRPTYRLSIGVAGSSHAFAISERLGLPAHIIARAKAHLTAEQQRVEELIRRVELDRRTAERERALAERLRSELEAEKARFEEERRRFREQKDAVLEAARAEAAQLLRRARLEAEQLIAELRKRGAQESVEEARAARQLLAEMEEELSRPARRAADESAPALTADRVRPGMTVRVRSLGRTGEVLTAPDGNGNLTVQLGGLKVNVSVQDVELAAPQAAPEPGPAPTVSGAALRGKAMSFRPELDLRGLTVAEALEKVEKYLDEALLAGAPSVRLIHGKGTGALRKAIQEYLDGNAHVRGYRLGDPNEGGAGVTIVEL